MRLWEATVMRVAGIGALTYLAVKFPIWWFLFLCGLGIFLLAGSEVTKK